MNRQVCVHRGVSSSIGRQMLPFLATAAVLAAALLAAPWSSPSAIAGEKGATSKPTSKPSADQATLKGEYAFGRRTGSFTAKLKAAGEMTYDVVYEVGSGSKPSIYKGTIKSDLAGEISGNGSSGGATFAFAGKFVDGVAKCPYKEVGPRGRNGSITLTK